MDRNQLIEQLRNEVDNVKDCFTRFSFQAIAFSLPILGGIIKFQNEVPEITLCSLLITIFALMVAKIGAHKYNTANRNLGFLLFQERRKFLPKIECHIFRDDGQIAWEEAMRAWRIVQATVFHNVYRISPLLPNKVKIQCNKDGSPMWFEPKKISSKEKAYYYPGSYLRNMQLILFFISLFALFPPLYMSILMYLKNDFIRLKIIIIPTIIVMLYYCWRIWRLNARRKILEEGLLSIHSSAILWEAVVIAYNLAIAQSHLQTEKLNKENGGSCKTHPLQYFASYLAKIASDLAESICNIYQWIEVKRKELEHIQQEIKKLNPTIGCT